MHTLNEALAKEVQVHQCRIPYSEYLTLNTLLCVPYSEQPLKLLGAASFIVYQCGFDVVAVCCLNFQLAQILEQVPAIR